MSNLNETLQLLNEYIKVQISHPSLWENFVAGVLPILQFLVILGGAIAGLYKYYTSKNREVYMQLLNEVYSPLYQYIVKQELMRNLMEISVDYREAPILSINSKKYKSNYSTSKQQASYSSSTSPVLDLSPQKFIDILDSINSGLLPKELYTLLCMYKVLIYMAESSNKTDTAVLSAAISRVNIEKKLRKEIICGYKKYHKRLGIDPGADDCFFELTDDQITFDINVTDEEIIELREQINANPDLY